MTLSPEVATLLRAALQEAGRLSQYPSLAYAVLAETVGNLLMPLPEGPDQGQPTDLFAPYLESGDEKDLPW